jgi:hypothetical protein
MLEYTMSKSSIALLVGSTGAIETLTPSLGFLAGQSTETAVLYINRKAKTILLYRRHDFPMEDSPDEQLQSTNLEN